MQVAELIIPQMFSAYAEDRNYINVQGCSLGYATAYSGLHHYQYFCEECDQVFSAAWGRIQGSMNYSERGSYFHCPHCGKIHRENVVYINLKETAPNKVRLVVKEYDTVVTFEVYCETVEFQDYLNIVGGKYKEIFRFDITKQTVLFSTFKSNVRMESIEIGNPFQFDILGKSILRYFRPNSLPNSNQKNKLSQILKVLRETVHCKLEKRLKHKVSSMYVSPGQQYGLFLLPIFNIAYRLSCPDAPNISSAYRFDRRTIYDFWNCNLIKDFGRAEEIMSGVIAQTRRKKDFITAMIEAHSLPDKPLIRRAIMEEPFGVNLLIKAFELCKNYDNAISMHRALIKLNTPTVNYKELFKFLKSMKSMYGEAGIIRMVDDFVNLQIRDCISLYKQLNDENKLALNTEKVRLRDFHDWLSLRHKKQNHINLKFDVPEHIVKRLSMQSNRLNFFLPKESIDLLEAGHTLHNCVASYGKAMKDNERWIVLVADDKGKLAACLEIKGKELLQAKLDKNQPVSCKAELNNSILDWAKEAKIKISTSDIKVPEKGKAKAKKSA